jgi:hypothetical protein
MMRGRGLAEEGADADADAAAAAAGRGRRPVGRWARAALLANEADLSAVAMVETLLEVAIRGACGLRCRRVEGWAGRGKREREKERG